MAAASVASSSQPSSSSTKKRKEPPTSNPDHPSSKKSKKERRKDRESLRGTSPSAAPADDSQKSSKSKRKKRTLSPPDDDKEFAVVGASVLLSIPPVFAANPKAGVEEMLDSMVMRHIPSLQGVVLSHSNHEFLDSSASIQNDCPYVLCRVAFDATVWSPKIGMTLEGKVNLFSPDHISLLIHRTFNISIPRSHIPDDEYEFEHGPAKNDPEFGAAAGSSNYTDDVAMMEVDETGDVPGKEAWLNVENTEAMIESVGRWVNRATGEKVGKVDRTVRFTVVGMTLANQMISLIGSLQPDPFNPSHSDPSSKLPQSKMRPQMPGDIGDLTIVDDDDESLPDIDQLVVNGRGGQDVPLDKRVGPAEEKQLKKARKEAKQMRGEGIKPPPKKKRPKKVTIVE